jgi:hypothetical protein
MDMMNMPTDGATGSELITKTDNPSGLDTVDTCRMRLLALRTRIETNWPAPGRRLLGRGQDMDRHTWTTISELLRGLPTPLPLHPGAEPESIICDTDVDLRPVPGRAVDAGLALLAGSTLDARYPNKVTMLESHRPSARGSIVVAEPTVGLIVATIIGTLDAVSEVLSPPVPRATTPGRSAGPTADSRLIGHSDQSAPQSYPDRAGRVPRP